MRSAFVRPPTAQAAVLSELRRRIGTGELRPGEPIRQDRLADELGVSRHPVREALRVLEGEGHIHHAPHRGYYVSELDLDALLEIYRMRDLLETEALRVGVPRLDAAMVARARRELVTMQELDPTVGMDELVRANRALHFLPFEAADMPRLLHHIRLLWDASEAYRSLYYLRGADMGLVHEEHESFVRALDDRDVERAVEQMRGHRDHAVERLRPLLEGARQPVAPAAEPPGADGADAGRKR